MSQALADGVTRFLQSLRNERRLSPHTEAAYTRDLKTLVAYCDEHGVTAWDRLEQQNSGGCGERGD